MVFPTSGEMDISDRILLFLPHLPLFPGSFASCPDVEGTKRIPRERAAHFEFWRSHTHSWRDHLLQEDRAEGTEPERRVPGLLSVPPFRKGRTDYPWFSFRISNTRSRTRAQGETSRRNTWASRTPGRQNCPQSLYRASPHIARSLLLLLSRGSSLKRISAEYKETDYPVGSARLNED
ncbi:hypothetical protein EVAR_44236_1 [Eumeta japonica]|uniref:Uncharacterized protein n=1 Tax=Eumeta variegata TaxID=151549 RepID=A0A4C1X8A3_EUMVA|nr:hypothetical protein EVAR_44236_1 [Eumeta japonica]